ncbi:MAG: LysM peptidoglycan-binding domain-containing protein [Chloroflexota bacterium]
MPASAQSCAARTDWLPYRVTFGDTLFRIAVRAHIPTASLASGNCIGNVNLIFVGQVLRVPPTAADAASSSVNIPVTFQQFENGFMIWRTDSNDIWVYFGQSSGRARQFLSGTYAALPDNPISTPTPSGRLRPILGFGRVWGNFASVRNALGWATAPEISYSMSYNPASSGLFYITLPDGHAAVTTASLLWSIFTGPVAGGASTVTVSAAYQVFENGFLLWRADTGRIEEFHANDVAGYNLDQYALLPDNPVNAQPPLGRVKPVFGFGRVWGNFPTTRSALGWGVSNEQGFQATFVLDLATFVNCVNLPDGQFVSYPHFDGVHSYSWKFEATCS